MSQAVHDSISRLGCGQDESAAKGRRKTMLRQSRSQSPRPARSASQIGHLARRPARGSIVSAVYPLSTSAQSAYDHGKRDSESRPISARIATENRLAARWRERPPLVRIVWAALAPLAPGNPLN